MNILITGFGGQGIITLKNILAYASIKEGKFFRASELHGLSQKGGSVEVHFRFGENISSPLINQREADLIIGLDLLEAARAAEFASAKSIFLANNYFLPLFQLAAFSKNDFLKIMAPITKNIFIIEAAEICQQKLKNRVFESVFLLGFAKNKNLIPFKENSLLFGIEKSVPSEFIKENKKAFNLGKECGK